MRSVINRGFIKKNYAESQRLSEIGKNALLAPKPKEKDQNRLNLLQINSKLITAFEQEPITTYRQNKNLGNLIGSKKILDGKVVRKNNSKK